MLKIHQIDLNFRADNEFPVPVLTAIGKFKLDH